MAPHYDDARETLIRLVREMVEAQKLITSRSVGDEPGFKERWDRIDAAESAIDRWLAEHGEVKQCER